MGVTAAEGSVGGRQWAASEASEVNDEAPSSARAKQASEASEVSERRRMRRARRLHGLYPFVGSRRNARLFNYNWKFKLTGTNQYLLPDFYCILLRKYV